MVTFWTLQTAHQARPAWMITTGTRSENGVTNLRHARASHACRRTPIQRTETSTAPIQTSTLAPAGKQILVNRCE